MAGAFPDLAVREAGLDDAAAIAGLLTQLGYSTTPAQAAERLASVIDRADHVSLVAEEDGAVVGFAGLRVSPSYEHDTPVAQVVAMVVDASARGRGVGERLLAAIERRAAATGAGKIVVTSATHRDGAHRFYEARGYTRTGLRFGKEL